MKKWLKYGLIAGGLYVAYTLLKKNSALHGLGEDDEALFDESGLYGLGAMTPEEAAKRAAVQQVNAIKKAALATKPTATKHASTAAEMALAQKKRAAMIQTVQANRTAAAARKAALHGFGDPLDAISEELGM